jgi:hypothetical protein
MSVTRIVPTDHYYAITYTVAILSSTLPPPHTHTHTHSCSDLSMLYPFYSSTMTMEALVSSDKLLTFTRSLTVTHGRYGNPNTENKRNKNIRIRKMGPHV